MVLYGKKLPHAKSSRGQAHKRDEDKLENPNMINFRE